MKHLLIFVLICFDLIQIFEEIASLSFQVCWMHQFLTEVKNYLDFGILRLGLSTFGVAACFRFDKGQSTLNKLDFKVQLYDSV